MISVLRPKGEILIKPFEVSRTNKELQKLAFLIKSIEDETCVITDYVGKYYETITNKLN